MPSMKRLPSVSVSHTPCADEITRDPFRFRSAMSENGCQWWAASIAW